MLTVPFGEYGLNAAILLISIMLSIGGVSLGLGYATNNRKFKDFGNEEILQSLINGALVGGLLVLLASGGVVCSLMSSIVQKSSAGVGCDAFLAYNPAICFAYNYLVGPNQYVAFGMQHNSILADVMGVTAALIGLYALLGGFKIFLSPLLSQIQGAVQVLGAAAVSATVQASVLAFVAVSALSIILPTGLLLRTFYPTRRLGGFLIALSIGLYVVLPMTYVMNAAIAGAYSSGTGGSSGTAITLNATGTLQGSFSAINQSEGNLTFAGQIAGLGSKINGFLDSIFNTMAYFIVYAFVLPAFSLMLTGISVRELSRLLGAENSFGKFNLI